MMLKSLARNVFQLLYDAFNVKILLAMSKNVLKKFLKNFRYFRKLVCLILKQFKNFEMSENVKNLKNSK